MSHAEYLNDYEAKHQILEVGRRMYEKGFVASNDGNISCRVSETELLDDPDRRFQGIYDRGNAREGRSERQPA